MIRVDRAELTRNEIIRIAANRFLNDGYAKTTISSMARDLNMSTGNMTFHFPTKEHLLSELVSILCKYQWELMEREVREEQSPIMAVCLELLSMASACEQDAVAREFFIASYTSEMSLDIIRKNDKERAKRVFYDYCSDWSDERFAEAGALVSGIEFATIMKTSESPSLETRIVGALDAILTTYNVPREVRERKIKRALDLDYRSFGAGILKEFRRYVDEKTEKAIFELIKKK